MQLTDLVDCDLTQPDTPPDMRIEGWDAPDSMGRRALSWRSSLTLPRPNLNGDLAVFLTVEPFLFPPLLTQQLLRIIVNGKTIRLAELPQRTIVIALIPADLVASRSNLEFTFEHPEAVSPNMVSASKDARSFSVTFASLALFAVAPEKQHRHAVAPTAAMTTLPPGQEELSDEQLLRHFASLGDNCEFGLLQRRAGVEVSDLLRFAGMRLPGLLRGLDSDFGFMTRLDDIEIQVRFLPKREFVLHWRGYSLHMHTLVNEGDMSIARFFTRELKKIQLQRRLMLDDLRIGDRIFVYKNLEVPHDADLVPLEGRLRRHGRATLLHVVPAQSARGAGRVEQLRPGIMRGYIDRFNPYDDAEAVASPMWLGICRRAYAMWRENLIASFYETQVAP